MRFRFNEIKNQNNVLLCEVIKLMYKLKDDQLQLYVGNDGIHLMREYEDGIYLEMLFKGNLVNVSTFDNRFELLFNKTYRWNNKFIQQD